MRSIASAVSSTVVPKAFARRAMDAILRASSMYSTGVGRLSSARNVTRTRNSTIASRAGICVISGRAASASVCTRA